MTIRRLAFIVTASVLTLVPIGAPQAAPQGTHQAPSVAPAPTLPPDAQRSAEALRDDITALTRAQAVLQREIDASLAQLQRTLQQAQAICAATPGYELSTTPTLACRTKKDEAKKDPPK